MNESKTALMLSLLHVNMPTIEDIHLDHPPKYLCNTEINDRVITLIYQSTQVLAGTLVFVRKPFVLFLYLTAVSCLLHAATILSKHC